ncbi:hypothetical protein Dfer_5464 [Dyadobacter fermentans DSM 18053]|uniref:Uncharacterized protein n=2 Tax=Dyadobacter fermentans TaxID=94254 RepID=C6VVC5_DYAFD|nr:hypothetical protein Dfer_5464 [Dyadobacter fermentans DSM 18053]
MVLDCTIFRLCYRPPLTKGVPRRGGLWNPVFHLKNLYLHIHIIRIKFMAGARADSIFRITTDKEHVICPPQQVFSNADFHFTLTVGGGLFEDECEYDGFRQVLQRLGETEFYILENIGATITDRSLPFSATISLDCRYVDFQTMLEAFEPPFGWVINHFFVFGNNAGWGIYVAEFPPVNIIGCSKLLLREFREAFGIEGNGYEQISDLIDREFENNPEDKRRFIEVYVNDNRIA